jgi:hypothetical protein
MGTKLQKRVPKNASLPARKRNGLIGSDPQWEEAKAARRNIDHNDAVQESFFLQKQYRSMWSHQVAASPVDLNQILRTLIRKKIPFVLTGAHGIGGWTGRPRGTLDVDILVKGGRNHGRAVNAIKELYSDLEVRDFAGVTAFFIPGEKQSVIDVTYPHRPDIEETLAHPVWTEDKASGLRYRIPDLEPALANKYGAMVTPTRAPEKRAIDIADFGWMVKHSTDPGRQAIDLEKLAGLGEKVRPVGGGAEILRLVDQVKAGKPISLETIGLSYGQSPG